MNFPIHVRTLTGLEDLLGQELKALGAKNIECHNRVVICTGDKSVLYGANIFCRTAIRVLLPIAKFPARNEKAFYDGLRSIDWKKYLLPHESLAIDAHVSSSFTTHSLYLAQLAKDAIVDQFRERTGERPTVDLVSPKLRITISLFQDQAEISLDSSGESLHKRGYRRKAGEAPLNEVLAAGIIQLSQWDGKVPLIDPMCGSGTLLIEAGFLLRNIVPGVLGRHYGFQEWKDYDRNLFETLLKKAKDQVRKNERQTLIGIEKDPQVVEIARENIKRAGIEDLIRIERGDFFQFENIPETPGILVMNPPYDERLPIDNIAQMYQDIGDRFKQKFAGWKAYFLSGNLEAVKFIGLRSSKRFPLYNGAIECRLVEYELRSSKPTSEKPKYRAEPTEINPEWKAKAETFSNRLKKNAKNFKKWAEKEKIDCYRVYDWDIPELAFIVDLYGDRMHFAEIERNHTRTMIEHQRYMEHMVKTAADVLQIPMEHVYFKKRKPQSDGFQYRSHGEKGEYIKVQEGGHQFLVNLSDYLDVGLFLDHRKTRAQIEKESKGKDFLNLFAYTGSFTVYAAAGGASSTTTVDTSNTYLDWAKENLRINNLLNHKQYFERTDSFDFLRQCRKQFDLAVVDPPTRSINKSAGRFFDVQTGHVRLLQDVLARLRPKGKIYFSTNHRKFEFDETGLTKGRSLKISEITSQTVPLDFERKPSHRCWLIEKLS